jgi:hypothetical protein
MNKNEKLNQKTVSRDFKVRDLSQEPKISQASEETTPCLTSRRGFFKSIIPLSGKALTDFLRGVGTATSESESSKK